MPTVYVMPIHGKKYLQLIWYEPDRRGGKPRRRQRSSGTNHRREADRIAARLEQEIADGLHETHLAWPEFRARRERWLRVHAAKSTVGQFCTAANHLEAILGPRHLGEITAESLSRLATELMGREPKPLSPSAAGAYLGHLHAALAWAVDEGYLRAAPGIKKPKKARGLSTQARSRAIVGEELDRLLHAAGQVRPNDPEQWQHLIRGLYHSGLRIGELLALSWTPGAPLWLDDSGAYPLIRVHHDGEKGHQDRFQPVTPEFWDLVELQNRRGLVFSLVTHFGKPMGVKRVIRILGEMGRKAGIVTDPTTGKCATSHDIGRRAFASRYASRMTPQELTAWMRHGSIATTMGYYVHADAIALSRRIWDADGR